MLSSLKAMSARYNRYMTYVGRKRACDALLLSSDRMLKDAGFSRELLQKGADAWPWLDADTSDAQANASVNRPGTADNLFNLDTKSGTETSSRVRTVEDSAEYKNSSKEEQDRRRVA